MTIESALWIFGKENIRKLDRMSIIENKNFDSNHSMQSNMKDIITTPIINGTRPKIKREKHQMYMEISRKKNKTQVEILC
jgi:hypothetical protein